LQPGAHPTSARSLKSWKRVTRCGAHLRPCSPAWRKHIMQQKTRTKHRRAHRNAPHSCLRSLRFRRTSVKPFVLKRIKKNPRTLKLLRYPPRYIYICTCEGNAWGLEPQYAWVCTDPGLVRRTLVCADIVTTSVCRRCRRWMRGEFRAKRHFRASQRGVRWWFLAHYRACVLGWDFAHGDELGYAISTERAVCLLSLI